MSQILTFCPLVQQASESDDSWEAEPAQDVEPPPKKKRGKKAVVDVSVEDADPGFDPTAHTLPRELTEADIERPFDPEDLGDLGNHVNYWREQDTTALVKCLNHHRKLLKGNFEGSGGGKERRDAAWVEVAGAYDFK